MPWQLNKITGAFLTDVDTSKHTVLFFGRISLCHVNSKSCDKRIKHNILFRPSANKY